MRDLFQAENTVFKWKSKNALRQVMLRFLIALSEWLRHIGCAGLPIKPASVIKPRRLPFSSCGHCLFLLVISKNQLHILRDGFFKHLGKDGAIEIACAGIYAARRR